MNLASIAAQARKDEQELGATIENMNWCDTSDIDFDRIKRVHEAMGRTASALEALASGPGQANDQLGQAGFRFDCIEAEFAAEHEPIFRLFKGSALVMTLNGFTKWEPGNKVRLDGFEALMPAKQM